MTETQKKELWQLAEVFRGTKASGNINDIVRRIIIDKLKPLVKEQYQNTNFIKNLDFNWQSTAQDDSVEYIQGTFEIDKSKLNFLRVPTEDSYITHSDGTQILDESKLVETELLDSAYLQLPTVIDYNDGRSIFLDIKDFFGLSGDSKKFESFGGIRYFKDGNIPPIEQAEQHIENYYSVARLLQMKVWWDAIPHESTPKLAAVYQWTADVTTAAIAGQTTFTQPPFTFDDITQEIASLG